MKKLSYTERLTIPIDGSSAHLYTKSKLIIAYGYERVVIGERGPYIEINDKQIVLSSIKIPDNEFRRIDNDLYYYIEYRSIDDCNVKVYFQKKTVTYADYKIGMFYISPELLITNGNDCLLLPLHGKQPSLFDLV